MAKTLPDTVPVARVPMVLKFCDQVKVLEVTPVVVITNVVRCPTVPPVALKVMFPVGVHVTKLEVMGTDTVPVVAAVDVDPVNDIFVSWVHAPVPGLKLNNVSPLAPDLTTKETFCEVAVRDRRTDKIKKIFLMVVSYLR